MPPLTFAACYHYRSTAILELRGAGGPPVLSAELSREAFKPDSEGERKMCKCLLKLINDQSSDVQSLAVKCLSPLVRKVHEERVDEIVTCAFHFVSPLFLR